jgi:tetratricopeptide (TPR) repeat protein
MVPELFRRAGRRFLWERKGFRAYNGHSQAIFRQKREKLKKGVGESMLLRENVKTKTLYSAQTRKGTRLLELTKEIERNNFSSQGLGQSPKVLTFVFILCSFVFFSEPSSSAEKSATITLERAALKWGAPLPQAEKIVPSDMLYQARVKFYDEDIEGALELLTRLDSLVLSKTEVAEKAFFEGEILWKRDMRSQAYQKYSAAKDALAENFFKSEALWKMAEVERDKDEREEAMKHTRESVALLPENRVRLLQAAYLMVSLYNDAEACEYFERAFVYENAEDYSPQVTLDAAYASKRAGSNQQAVKYLERYIDAQTELVESKDFDKNSRREDVERLYDARREHADIVRKLGVNAGTYYVRTDGDYSLQGIAEVYWQPWYRNGKQLQIFGQLTETFATRNDFDGSKTFFGAVGARLEPLSDYNLVFTLEQQIKIGDWTRDDARGRVGYSWDTGLELEPWVPSWAYVALFTEYARSFSHSYSLFYGNARYGRSFRQGGLDGRLVITPHVLVAWNYNSEAGEANLSKWAWHGGLGLHFRNWYREDKYNAPKSYWDLFLQYRFGLDENSEDTLTMTLFNSF